MSELQNAYDAAAKELPIKDRSAPGEHTNTIVKKTHTCWEHA
jgi:hypothetical protein